MDNHKGERLQGATLAAEKALDRFDKAMGPVLSEVCTMASAGDEGAVEALADVHTIRAKVAEIRALGAQARAKMQPDVTVQFGGGK